MSESFYFDSAVVRDYSASATAEVRHISATATAEAASQELVLFDASMSFMWTVMADRDGPVAQYLEAPFGASATLTVDAADATVPDGGSAHEALILGVRPGEWFVLGSGEAVDGVVEAVIRLGQARGSALVTARDFTHGRALFRLTGKAAPKVLEKLCSLDWSDPITPDGAVMSGSVARVSCDIARDDIDGACSYLIVCDRSVGQYLFDVLIDAGIEFGVSVGEPAPPFG